MKYVHESMKKNPVVVMVVCFLFGWTGAHRFMVGDKGIAISQLLTFGWLGFWWIDLFFMWNRTLAYNAAIDRMLDRERNRQRMLEATLEKGKISTRTTANIDDLL